MHHLRAQLQDAPVPASTYAGAAPARRDAVQADAATVARTEARAPIPTVAADAHRRAARARSLLHLPRGANVSAPRIN